MNTISPADIEALYGRDDWLGFGYLGGRRAALDGSDPESPARPELVAKVDQIVADHATASGWTVEELFAWANSKHGRWFADVMLNGGDVAANLDRAVGWGLLQVPS